MTDIDEALKAHVEKVEAAFSKAMTENMQQYMNHVNDMIAQSQREMAEMIGQAQAVNNPKPANKPKPQAIWAEEQGEKLLILNEPAAQFFQNIFENVGALTKELEKLAKPRR